MMMRSDGNGNGTCTATSYKEFQTIETKGQRI